MSIVGFSSHVRLKTIAVLAPLLLAIAAALLVVRCIPYGGVAGASPPTANPLPATVARPLPAHYRKLDPALRSLITAPGTAALQAATQALPSRSFAGRSCSEQRPAVGTRSWYCRGTNRAAADWRYGGRTSQLWLTVCCASRGERLGAPRGRTRRGLHRGVASQPTSGGRKRAGNRCRASVETIQPLVTAAHRTRGPDRGRRHRCGLESPRSPQCRRHHAHPTPPRPDLWRLRLQAMRHDGHCLDGRARMGGQRHQRLAEGRPTAGPCR